MVTPLLFKTPLIKSTFQNTSDQIGKGAIAPFFVNKVFIDFELQPMNCKNPGK
jgi:hypothetical protein